MLPFKYLDIYRFNPVLFHQAQYQHVRTTIVEKHVFFVIAVFQSQKHSDMLELPSAHCMEIVRT
eukprot:8656081-Karenia_brevis.AAC.1